MLNITNSAKEELQRALQRTKLAPDKYLRLAVPPVWVGEGDFGIVVDSEGEHDHIVMEQERILLLVDSHLAERLKDSVLDFKDLSGQAGLTLDVY